MWDNIAHALYGNLNSLSTWHKRDISSNVIVGDNPIVFDPPHPITLFIVQLFIIVVFTQGIGFFFGYIKQPKVIAEVVGGILLGPTVMGRIPGFSDSIFPKQSISYLNLISNFGLILFLFLVGLEVDVGIMKKNGKNAALISVVGMVVPFGLGAAVAVPLYNNFVDKSVVTFGHFVLFVGVAISITAFPVLCRILTSTKLLETRVGVVVLAAGVGNDVVGWVLLALTLALVNANAGETAVYILLAAVGWTLLLLFPIKWGFLWLARRTGSLTNGPTPTMMIITLMIVFASAFVTGIIGVHPIFGAFIAGLIIPHEGGFAIALVEKIDDLVTMLFLPIYFVLSGLSTNLGLLNTGTDWGYTILLCVIAWVGKFGGCAGMARGLGYSTRESGAIGMLMSCKGLVELIVLNVGLSAGILNVRLFSMFVVMAVVLTFITTPFTLLIYPEKHRESSTGAKALKRSATSGDVEKDGRSGDNLAIGPDGSERISRCLVVLQRIEHLASVMLLTQMLEPPTTKSRIHYNNELKPTGSKLTADSGDVGEGSSYSTPAHGTVPLPELNEDGRLTTSSSGPISSPIQLDALKLIELTERTYSVMQSAEKDQLLLTDDALQLYRQFGRLRGLDITPHISIVGQDSFPPAVAEHADQLSSQLVIVPWIIPASASVDAAGPTSPSGEGMSTSVSATFGSGLNPFEGVFGGGNSDTSTGSPMYTHFIRRVFSETPTNLALFIDRGYSGGLGGSFSFGSGQHIFMPFFGGPDDRLALRFVVQLCHHTNVTATVVKINRPEDDESSSESGATSAKVEMSESMQAHQTALQSNQLTVGPHSSVSQIQIIV